jgi:succinyl-CoA synthetase beta subunit
MNLREYQAKQIFRKYGLRVPAGALVADPPEAESAARKLGCPVVLKPQLGVKGRGKVGGIGFADDPVGARREAERLFALTVKGETVLKLLVEKRLAISEELYTAVTIDYAARQPVMIVSSAGGVDIEETARVNPERIHRIPIHILTGVEQSTLAVISRQMGTEVSNTAKSLYRIFRDYDAELVEINPLIRTADRELWAADAVLNINADSVFRHDNLLPFKQEIPVTDPIAEEAAANSWTYIDLPGNIGILSSGAGLTMAILDLIHKAGGEPANFLDTAQMDDEGIFSAFDLLARAKETRVLLVNVFAGLNRCDRLADGIRRYLERDPMKIPLVVRMVGNLEEEGHGILREIGITPFTRLEDAVVHAVELARSPP